MKNNQVTFLNDDLKNHGDNGLEEGGTKVRKTIGKVLKSYKNTESFGIRLKKW